MNQKSDMTRILKRVALFTGFATLAISIYFSYDGFDQSVNGSNAGYTILAIVIGLTLAVVVSVVQFIFGTSYAELNWTLRFAGLAAYVYSIYTNYLGIKHILGADDFMAISSALFMDVYPEPAIAWALGEALTGDFLGNFSKIARDFLGNLGKIAFGDNGKPPQSFSYKKPVNQHRPSQYKPIHVNNTMFSDRNQKPQSTVHTPTYHPTDDHKQGEFYPIDFK